MRLCLPALLSGCYLFAADPSSTQIREAATKAVAIIQKGQTNWYMKASCVSCHQQVFPALAFQSAREHGITVDERAAHADAAAAFSFYSNLPRAVEYTYVIDPPLSDGYALIAAHAAGLRPSLVTAVYARLIAARQEADGHWETIDERPPESYSPFTATAVALRAVQLYAHPSQRAEVGIRTKKALQWLVTHQPHATEDRVYQLRGALWAGADQSTRQTMATALKATQEADGGWSSLDGRSSDAYSTGQVLVALHDAAGLDAGDPAWRPGIEYLLKTQTSDGSWHVVSRLHPPAVVSPPYFETGHPCGHDQFISMMGNSLAVMALARALPTVTSTVPALSEAKPVAVETWAQTMLFGHAAAVKSLLDSGFDPNSATRSGGLTALTLAAPDTAKMKLLLARGANPNARTKDRFSPLLVAAQYSNSSEAINLLLDHGAEVSLPKGQGAPTFNAFPIFLAAFSGNSTVIARLKQAGDHIDGRMNVIGMFPASPLLFLATSSRTESVTALLDAGAKVDETDLDGITSLSWATIANRVDMAKLLIQRGADVNHVDKKGMTPLLYSASIDFGDSAIIELLIQSGAHIDARNREGLTALDLARKSNHTHLIASLRPSKTTANAASAVRSF
jgi:ankyrin repeat protein